LSNHTTCGIRRLTVFGATVAAALMLAGSIAWACTAPTGTTYFTNGKVVQTVARGSKISAYATGAPQGVGLKLVIGSDGEHPTHACMETNYTINNTVRFAGSDGFIAPTAGPAGDANLPKATYQVCFTDYLSKEYSTSAATLTII
jgi:hypothetical protein